MEGNRLVNKKKTINLLFCFHLRDIIAGGMILNLPERIDWKQCVKSEDEEKQISKDFRTKFHSFDPSNK